MEVECCCERQKTTTHPVDAERNALTLEVPEQELEARRAQWIKPPYKATRGTLAKYIRLVKNASEGCVTDEE